MTEPIGGREDDTTAPAQDLDEALAAMSWTRLPGRYALAGFPEPPGARDLELLAPPAQLVREEDETTLLVRGEHLPTLMELHPGARVEDDLVWIRFEAVMGWEVVGFLARVSSALAEAGVPIGAVCSFARDHLFIASSHAETAERVLVRLFPRSSGPESGGPRSGGGKPAIGPDPGPGSD